MTNYEKLFQEQMQEPEFAKAYWEARLERTLDEFFESLKEKISHDEPKEILLSAINSMQSQLSSRQP